jgi:hypothetical protein
MSAKAKLQKEEELRCCVIYREFNIRSKSAYNTNNYGLSVDGTNGDLYTCTYQGVLYLALIPSYTVSAVEYGFDGYIVGDDNSLIVNYRNSQTSTVLNPEINNSLTINKLLNDK